MFLQPAELGFLKYLKEARVPVVEFEFPSKKLVNVQSQLEKLISKNYYLNNSAKDGYKYYSPTPPLCLLCGWMEVLMQKCVCNRSYIKPTPRTACARSLTSTSSI